MKSVLEAFDAELNQAGHGPRLRAVRRAAEAVRDGLLDQPSVRAVRTLPLARLPYPTRFAFQGAAWSPVPFVQMEHRCLLVQFSSGGALRTLLFNPSDVIANRATPFFADFIRAVGPLERLFAPPRPPLEAQLAALGLTTADVDYIAFDHFHTQDLRPLLGTADGSVRPRFPRAVLLAPRSEWIDWDALHPMQRAWYVREGKRDLCEERVRLFDGSLHLGDGVVLLRTPGHTSGNQTLLVRTSDGIWGCSENGTSCDNWSPHASRMPGLARFARKYDLEVLINSNTPELGAAQYTSMIAERTIVDVAAEAPEFVRMFPSSEVTASALAPGASPTWQHEAVTDGAIVVPSRTTTTPGAGEHVGAP
jgi:hypothetical protein